MLTALQSCRDQPWTVPQRARAMTLTRSRLAIWACGGHWDRLRRRAHLRGRAWRPFRSYAVMYLWASHFPSGGAPATRPR